MLIVDKIHKYLDQDTDKEVNEEWLDSCLDNIRLALISQLFSKRKNKPGLRLSSIGKCLRAQAYGLQDIPKKPIGHRQKLTFLMGDIIEELVVLLAKHAEVKLTDEQKEVMFHGVPGHIDGMVDDNYVFECKSMAEIGFNNFVRSGMDDSFGYLSQLNSYASALGSDMLWVGWNKNTCHLHEEVCKVDKGLVERTKGNIDKLKANPNPESYPRLDCFKEETFGRKTKANGMNNKTGNVLLDAPCSYCDYAEACWDGKVTKYLRGGKFKYYVGNIKHGEWSYGGEVINE